MRIYGHGNATYHPVALVVRLGGILLSRRYHHVQSLWHQSVVTNIMLVAVWCLHTSNNRLPKKIRGYDIPSAFLKMHFTTRIAP